MKLRDLLRWLCFAAQPLYIIKNKAGDTSGVNDAARESAALGREAFNWFQNEYRNTADERAAAEKRANDISDANLASMNYALGQAKDAEAYNKSTFRPLEQRLVSEAQSYDTAERRNAEAGTAVAEVNRQAGAQRLAAQQELARAGVSPESGKSQALMEAGGIEAAKAAAGADYTARKNVEQQGYARMADAASLGRNLPSQQATQQSLATGAGTGSLQASQQALGARMSGAGLMQSGFSSGLAGAQASGNLYGQAAQLGGSGGADLGGLGSLLGGGAALYKSGALSGIGAMFGLSSKDAKTEMRPADNERILASMRNLDVGTWSYKPGLGDEGKHIGPYAEDVQRELGDEVAPSGKVINLTAMSKASGKALSALDGKVRRVEARMGRSTAPDPVQRGLKGEDPIDAIGVQVSMIKALANKVDALEKRSAGGK